MKKGMLLAAVLCMGIAVMAQGKIVTDIIEYKQGETTLEGYVAYDDAISALRPGIIVVHEWMGLNEYAKWRCDSLAKLGYVAFAADIYGKGVRAQTPEEAGKLAGQYRGDRPLMRARIQAAVDWLKGNMLVDSSRIAAIGYCFGGTVVLELARSGANVKGVVSFHGNLETPTPATTTPKAKILVQHGAIDSYVAPESISKFEKEMNDVKADWQFTSYSGAVHGFTNPKAGDNVASGYAYNETADKRSWQAMRNFFDEIFTK
jgi:dienelactone hydrolase